MFQYKQSVHNLYRIAVVCFSPNCCGVFHNLYRTAVVCFSPKQSA